MYNYKMRKRGRTFGLNPRGTPFKKRPLYRAYPQRRTQTITRRQVGELKGMDTFMEAAAMAADVNTNDTAWTLNLIQQGAGSWNRVGRKVQLNSLRVRGWIKKWHKAGRAFDAFDPVRIVVVFDKQPSGTTIPNWSTVFGQTTQDGSETSTTASSLRYDNTDRFHVLKDTVIQDPTKTQPWQSKDQSWCEYFDMFIGLKGKHTVFSGQSDPMTNADISSGAVYVYFRDLDIVSGFTYYELKCNARLRYYDA